MRHASPAPLYKTYFPNDKLTSERKTYYFEEGSKILRNKFVTLYGDSVEQTPNLYPLMDTVIDILTTASSTPLPPNSDSQAEAGTIPGERRGNGGSNINEAEYASAASRSGMRQKVTGVVTERGRIIPVRAVVLTTGTFLGGRIFIGEYDAPCGRVGESAAYGLTESLHRLGFTTGRLKTGTPPRILKKTIFTWKRKEKLV